MRLASPLLAAARSLGSLKPLKSKDYIAGSTGSIRRREPKRDHSLSARQVKKQRKVSRRAIRLHQRKMAALLSQSKSLAA